MKLDRLSYREIPEGCCVIRKKKTRCYLHHQDGLMFFKEKMHGCFVVIREVAEDIVNTINQESEEEKYEILTFHDAYKQHGLVEKQKCYN